MVETLSHAMVQFVLLFLHLFYPSFIRDLTSMLIVLNGDDLVSLVLKLLNEIKFDLLLILDASMLRQSHLFELLAMGF